MSDCDILPLTLWAGVGKAAAVVVDIPVDTADIKGSDEVAGENCEGL